MKRTLMLTLVCLLVTACHPGFEVEIINNSGQDLVVISLDTKLRGTSYPIPDNQAARIKVWYQLKIQHHRGVWEYYMPARPLPKEFGKRIGSNRFLHRYQIAKNGVIYVLLPDGVGSETNFPAQPAGFPVQPK
jgi:hypothetical protein